jgi:ABC-type nitrate/sulfonate/bicarbonate transport system permease component
MRRILSQSWAVVLLLVVWAVWVRHSGLNGIVIVSPAAVARELLNNGSQYIRPALHTAAVAIFGIVAGLFCGLLLAIAAWSSRSKPSSGAAAYLGAGGVPDSRTLADFWL